MAIEEITGDLFETPASTIMHGCNTQGVMGSGVALQIRNRYPEAYATYINHIQLCREANFNPVGRYCQQWCNNKLIVNLYTQEYYGRDGKAYAKLNYIHDSIQFFFHGNAMSEQTIAMPRIGCGLGGLKWVDVKPLLENLSDLYNVDFLVYSI